MKKGMNKYSKAAAAAAALILALVLLSGFAACKKSGPKLKNGDFESVGGDGVPTGWYAFAYDGIGTADAVSDPERGVVAHIVSDQPADARLVYDLAVEPDTEYEISCFVRTKDVVGGAGANIGVYGIAVASPGVTGTSGWQQVKLTGKTASDQDTLKVSVCLGTHGSLASGEAWFDGFEVRLAENGASNDVMFGVSSSGKTAEKNYTSFPTGKVWGWTVFGAVLLGLLFALHRIFANRPYKQVKGSMIWPVLMILFAALVIRIILAYAYFGHKTDMNCFLYWGRRVAEKGPAHFYGRSVAAPVMHGALESSKQSAVAVYTTSWCDYPPGYMLIIGFMYKLGTWLRASDATYCMLIKLPAILADLAAAFLVYVYAKRRMRLGAALTLAALAAFTPVFAYISAVWGQIDQVLTLLLVIPILLLYDRKPILAGLVYGVAIVMKPQALMAGPLLAAAYMLYVFRGNPYRKFASKRGLAWLTRSTNESFGLRFLETVLAVAAALAVIFAVALIFKGDHRWGWLISKYYGTATSYDYATVNAYNFWAHIGANWKSTAEPYLGLTYGKWGTIAMAATVVFSIAAYVFAALRHKNCKGALPLTMALMFSGIFTFGHYMHERYVFPVLLLLLFAYIFYNDRRMLWVYVGYGVSIFLNCLAAFYYSELMDVYRQVYDRSVIFNEPIIFVCSLANMAAFWLLAYITIDLVIRNKPLRGYNG